MNLRILLPYNRIFDRADFTFISDPNTIKKLLKLIEKIRSPISKEEEIAYLPPFTNFIRCLDSFFNWISCTSITELSEGYTLIRNQLALCVIFLGDEMKRNHASSGKIPSMRKKLVYGLKIFSRGIAICFCYWNFPKTAIDNSIVVRFILDPSVGFGRRYKFNVAGNFAFATHIKSFDRDSLVKTCYLLEERPESQTRLSKGWTDMGVRKNPIRLLLVSRNIRKDLVYFAFLARYPAEHEYYCQKLREGPEKCIFEAL